MELQMPCSTNYQGNFGDITIYFHQGFLQAAEYVFESISNLLDRDYENIYFVGHSYGAAVSNVLCVLTKLNNKYKNRQVYSYAFAPPPSMSTIPGQVQECMFSFINAHDIVPHLSLSNVRNTIDLMNLDIRKFFNSVMSKLEKSDTFGKSLRTIFLQYENDLVSLITGASQSFHVKKNIGNLFLIGVSDKTQLKKYQIDEAELPNELFMSLSSKKDNFFKDLNDHRMISYFKFFSIIKSYKDDIDEDE